MTELILRPAAEAHHLPGRELPASLRARRREEVIDPDLPTLAEINRPFVNEANELLLSGWVLSPLAIDDVVIHVGGQSLGCARYPVLKPELIESHPEYRDPNGGIWLRLQVRPDRVRGREGRVEFYSGDDLILIKQFEVAE